jgi:uncharacterized repeat protein (TIGR01451 family)
MLTLSGAAAQIAGAAAGATISVSITATPVAPDAAWATGAATPNGVTYTITVTNTGPSAAKDVTIADALPDGVVNATFCQLAFGLCKADPVTFDGTQPIVIGSMGSKTAVSYEFFAGVDPEERGGQKSLTLPTTVTWSAGTRSVTAATSVLIDTTPTVNLHGFGGDHNLVVFWSADGGLPIISYTITVTSSQPVPSPVTITSSSTDSPCSFATLQCDFTKDANGIQLNNDFAYSVNVTATNQIGTSRSSDPTATVSLTPALTKSAHIFTNCTDTGCTQSTGEQQFPDSTFPQIEQETVPNGSSVIGALSEASDSAQTFCGGLPCIGQLAVNQLTHTVDGRYLMTVLYDKTIAGGTGTSFTVWFAPSGSTTSSPIAKCPTKGPLPPTTACVTKIIRIPASNPDLKVEVSVPGSIFDPAWGSR